MGMKIVLTGATGFVGRPLASRLVELGHDLVVLSRDASRAQKSLGIRCESFAWDPMKGPPPPQALFNAEAVIHLAGEPVAAHRWTPEQMARIRDSRVVGTRNLMKGVALATGCEPKIIIGASAVGYYGDRGDEELGEGAGNGKGFLAEVCQAWETELLSAKLPEPSEGHETRRVLLRIGVVLGHGGGALEKLVPIFKRRGGGTIGSGRQWMPWIHIDDLVALILYALEKPTLQGAVNATGPAPATNKEFTHALAHALNVIAILPAPAFAVRLALGKMSEAVLASHRVLPRVALAAGFRFKYPTLEGAFAALFQEKE